ncbi:hypothetical protein HYPSUDRAFT_204348 [Hypholoma sublateritium FD-334 SS-4]|uniref:Uncharacterized protein n=1 Tax=Hypholoma sublateritium (strain FD-334 SS-4) TaxID=945553 RepID=A0A0D2NT68_HYPSF|nr:hypothetical protein HYPSUDRAFT_204348 [Hypholoma sublateritium FD-334 SS-4]
MTRCLFSRSLVLHTDSLPSASERSRESMHQRRVNKPRRSGRPSLIIRPLPPVDDEYDLSEYSPPDKSRAGQFERLERQTQLPLCQSSPALTASDGMTATASLDTAVVNIAIFVILAYIHAYIGNIIQFISSFTVNDYDAARLRKHEDDLIRISRAMRYGQLRSNDRIHRAEQKILELALESSRLKDETRRLLFMIDDLEECYIERSITRNEDV